MFDGSDPSQARRAVEVENGAMFGGKEMKVEMAEQTEEETSLLMYLLMLKWRGVILNQIVK